MDARHLAPHAATDVHQTGSRGGAGRRGERAQVLQGLSDGAAPVAGNERFTCHLEAAPWGARHAVPPHPSLEVGASRNAADPDEG